MTPAADKAGPPERLNGPDLGLAMLAVGAGSMDVFGFALGGALPSAMTGNTALLGLALGQRFDSDSATGTTVRSPLTGLCSMTLSTAKNTRFDGKIGADASADNPNSRRTIVGARHVAGQPFAASPSLSQSVVAERTAHYDSELARVAGQRCAVVLDALRVCAVHRKREMPELVGNAETPAFDATEG